MKKTIFRAIGLFLLLGFLVSCGEKEVILPNLKIAVEGINLSRRAPCYEIIDGDKLKVTMAEFMDFDIERGIWYPKKGGEQKIIKLSSKQKDEILFAIQKLLSEPSINISNTNPQYTTATEVWIYVQDKKYFSFLEFTCHGQTREDGVDQNMMNLLKQFMKIGSFPNDEVWGKISQSVITGKS